MEKLSDIKGMDDAAIKAISDAGIQNAEAFLQACAQKKDRKALAEKTGLGERALLDWANRVDLSRIKGVSTQYADLLESAGVDTVPELAQRNAANLHAKMSELNETEQLVKKLPTVSQVEDWIAQAKELPRAIHY